MKTKPLMLALTSAAVVLCGPAAPSMSAQPVIPPPIPAYYQPLSDQQLDQLLGPVALYPDPLLAVLLPAATFPAQIVLADRYVMSGGDPGQIDWQPWDPSVKALAHYPSVLKYMDDNLGWTTELGQAFLYQQPQVMDAIQRLRVSAQNFGNLISTPQVEVVNYGSEIEILPAEPEVIYVPVYQPTYVYCQSGFVFSFGIGCTIGPWLDCDFDWHEHHLCFWDYDHPRPADWWHGRPEWREHWIAHEGTVWHPGDHRDGDRHRGDRDDRDWNHRDNGEWNRSDNHNWNRPDDRNWNQAVNNTPPPRNESVVWMSRRGADPRPAANRPSGSIYVANPNPPVPSFHPENNHGASAGGERWRDAGNFNNRGHDAMPTVSRPEPTWSAPTHSEPAHYEPAHSAPSAPPVSYSHSESSYHGGGGGGGSGGGSHGSGSQSQSQSRH